MGDRNGGAVNEEHRREKRKAEENRVHIKVRAEDGDKTFYALTKDISSGGIKILTDEDLEIGTELDLEISLSRIHKIVNVMGTVRWTNSLYDGGLFEVGMEFVDTPPERVLFLLEYVYREEKA